MSLDVVMFLNALAMVKEKMKLKGDIDSLYSIISLGSPVLVNGKVVWKKPGELIKTVGIGETCEIAGDVFIKRYKVVNYQIVEVKDEEHL